MPRTVEKAFNFELAKQLRLKHPRWREEPYGTDIIAAEQTGVLDGQRRKQPDIVIRHVGGQPVVVETEYFPANTVEKEAIDRLGSNIDGRAVEGTIAVRIPDALGRKSQSALGSEIRKAFFEYCLLYGDSDKINRWPEQGWLSGNLDNLAEAIESVALSVTLTKATDILQNGIDTGTYMLRSFRLERADMLPQMAEFLFQSDSQQTTRMAVAIITNAFVFQAAIAGNHNIPSPESLLGQNSGSLKLVVSMCWQKIMETNYWPIFNISNELMRPVPGPVARPFLEYMIKLAGDLTDLGTASMHDLSGQMFQRLISDRKFLATFYTLPSSATMLANLATSRLSIDWTNQEDIKKLRIADFACGTGTLISAAQHAVSVRFRRTGGDDRVLHKAMMEQILVATDIMPAATHLTASTLSSAHPNVCFDETNIFTLPYGADTGEVRIGALDLIDDKKVRNLFGTSAARRPGGRSERVEQTAVIEHESCDLVIMNPPFTNPTNHESTEVPVPSFAGFGTSEDEQKAMSDRLRHIRESLKRRREREGAYDYWPEPAGHGNAGLASNFMDIAHAKLRPGGCLALVVPASFSQGAATKNARKMLEDFYDDVIIVAIATDGKTDRAFSSDTGMGEILLLGTRRERKRQTGEEGTEGRNVLSINLRGRPSTQLEGSLLAEAIENIRLGKRISGNITLGDNLIPAGSFRFAPFNVAFRSAGIRECGLIDALVNLTDGKVVHPQTNASFKVPITHLGNLGDTGKGSRDINGANGRGPFDVVAVMQGEYPTYPILWAHHAGQDDGDRERCLVVEPDRKGMIRTDCNVTECKGTNCEVVNCNTAKAQLLWNNYVSRLHFNLNFRINSQSLTACLTERPAIGGEAWPNFLVKQPEWELPILLWANTTLGLMLFWWYGTRQQEGRSRLSLSRHHELLSLDARTLRDQQFTQAENIFERFRERPFLPANEAWRDEVRKELDSAVLIELLELDPSILEGIEILREQWCREPSVHGGQDTQP